MQARAAIQNTGFMSVPPLSAHVDDGAAERCLVGDIAIAQLVTAGFVGSGIVDDEPKLGDRGAVFPFEIEFEATLDLLGSALALRRNGGQQRRGRERG